MSPQGKTDSIVEYLLVEGIDKITEVEIMKNGEKKEQEISMQGLAIIDREKERQEHIQG